MELPTCLLDCGCEGIVVYSMFGVHPTQVGGWKKQALAGLIDVFGRGREQNRFEIHWA